MKNVCKALFLSALMIVAICSTAFAGERHVLRRTYTFENTASTSPKDAIIKIYIGQKDITSYQKDGEIFITPSPSKTEEDKYGNVYAIYDVSNYKMGRSITISVNRDYESSSFEQDVAKRSEATVDDKNSLYIEAQEYVDSLDSEMIAKAKEITYGLSSDYKRALAIFEYVNTTMTYDTSSNFANKGSLSALKNKKGICEEYATLYAALCRCLGIPCKIITGYKISNVVTKEAETLLDPETGTYYTVPEEKGYELTPHAWNEIWMDDYGWLPVDTCVVYTKDGNRTAYLDSFCKIDGSEYLATGIYSADTIEYTYTSCFKNTLAQETLTVGDSVEGGVTASEHRFLDLDGYEWAEDSINTLYFMNVIKGYTDEEYGPGGNVTRIEFICLLARVLKQLNYTPATSGKIYYYMDYDKTHYSKQEYDFLMRCLEEIRPYDSKFAVGYGAMDYIFGSTLNINKPITRAEVVALMDPFLRFRADGTAQFSDMYDTKFSDSISKAYTNKLINGYEDGTFKPNNPISRAEIAVILDRYVGVKDFVM